jgi:hypothetical protein
MSGGPAVSRSALFALAALIAVTPACRKKDRAGTTSQDTTEPAPAAARPRDDPSPAAVEALRARKAVLLDGSGKTTGPVTTAYLAGPGFGDDDVALLRHLVTLRILGLRGTKVTDAGLAPVAELRALNHLDLAETGITDTGLPLVRDLQSLHYLYLNQTGVTDAGLDTLAAVKSLKHLEVRKTRVTAAGVAKLRAAVPGLIVSQDTRWYSYTSPDGRFTATFPWKLPTPRSRTQGTPFGQVADTILEAEQGSYSAALSFADFTTPPLAGVALDRVIDAGRDAVAKGWSGTVARDERKDYGMGNFVRNVTIEIPSRPNQGPVHFRYLAHGRRLYTLAALADGGTVPAEEVEQFFSSFRIVR